MYGIIGEDDSDTQTLKVLVKRIADNPSLRVKTKSYNGCSKMLRKGAKDLKAFKDLNVTHFVVCHDADGSDPEPKRDLVMNKIVRPSGLDDECCIVIPVQELEAWILADIECVSNVFTSWKPQPIDNPEAIPQPKEHLEKLSRDSNHRPRYSHAVHNEKMAEHLNLDRVAEKCSAFRTLARFVKQKPYL